MCDLKSGDFFRCEDRWSYYAAIVDHVEGYKVWITRYIKFDKGSKEWYLSPKRKTYFDRNDSDVSRIISKVE